MFDKSDVTRNEFQLTRGQAKCGYDWWWHSFTGRNEKTGEEKPFFIEFFVCNPALSGGGDRPIFGQLKENREKGIKPSYLMVKVGAWGEDHAQLHRFFGWNKVMVKGKAPFSIEAEDCFLSERETHGRVVISKEEATAHPEYMCDSGTMEWNLKIEKKIPFNVGYGASKLFSFLQLFEMFWHAEGMKTIYEDKNWGKNFTSPWVWLSSNHLVSKITGKKLENSVFDIGGGRPKIAFISLPRKLLSAFYYEGRCFEFNFSKFWTMTRTRFTGYEQEDKIIWHVEQKTWNTQVVVDVECLKKDMILFNYEAPTGEKRHTRLWNGGNGVGTIKLYQNGQLIDEMEAKNIGCEYGEFDTYGPYQNTLDMQNDKKNI
ncbi:hypothetical protein LY90DRAFT_697891 [Neocallimastix californiae]|uniref:Tocopherol cyclase n=1 Tax=Neocallimastix californiae TaxID=1754190 RepID=A0A1Y2F9Q1_9FUNG|nr:hypothetical protein LY90DRAFT_697891 [Neocallimastix californiae]|eukprot:ORY80631.1 hypothetical protein LY90DRAFT_697891 [Neocallimastix californiae]